MTVGDKIKKIRTFRGMTQKELGLAIGFEEKGADNRIAQYETNYRVPKRELLDKMAEALRVDRQNFYTIAPGSAEDFMRTFFWLDEDSPGAIRLFQLVRNPGRAGAADDTAVRYNDSDDWPAHPPVGMYFQYGLVDEFMREWLFRQQELHAGEITREEYFEWKLNWPHTCDDGLESEYYIPWREKINKTSKKTALLNFVVSAGRFLLVLFGIFSLENTGRTQIVSIQYQEQYGRAKKPVFMRVCAVSSVIPTQVLGFDLGL